MHILTVEDEESTATLFRKLLKTNLKASVDTAPDCASARQRLSSNSYDLIIMDYQLPDGDGLSFLEEIVRTADAPPVVMVTSHGDEKKTAVSAFKLGASGYVVKDARMSTLLIEEVRSALARAGQAKVEEATRVSEERYRNVFDNSRNGIAVYEAVRDGQDFVFKDFNKAAEAIEGVSREDVVGKSVLEVFPGVREFGIFDVFQRVWKTGIPESHLVSQYADERIAGWRDNYVYKLSSGEVVAVYEDVTEQKQAQESLLEREARLLAITEGAMDAIILVDSKLIIRHWNPAAENLYGFTEEEAVGQSAAIIFPEPRRQAYISALEEFIHTGQRTFAAETPLEILLIGKHGTEFPIEASISRFQIGDEWHVEYIARDITRRKRAEERRNLTTELLLLLNRSEQDTDVIKEILDKIKEFTGLEAVGIRLQKGDDFPYYESNGFAASFLKVENYLCSYSRDRELLRDEQGRPVLECMCGNILRGRTDPSKYFFTEGGSFWTNSTTHLLATTTVEDRQAVTRNYCNTVGYESVAIVPLHSDDEIIGLIHLVDHRKDMFTLDLIEFFEEMGSSIGIAITGKEYQERIERANRELEGYARTVSHDLRGPVSAASMALDMLLSDLEEVEMPVEKAEQLREMIEAGRSSMSNANNIIESLLAVAEAGEPQDVFTVSIEDAVDRVLEENAETIKEKGITVEIASPLGQVLASPTQIYQLFSNLIRNSIKHNRAESPLIEISSLGVDGTAHTFLVRDNGQGIPDEILDDVFTPFVKAQSIDSGIGLSIVEKIVRAYGGEIRAYNDNGACFEFTLLDWGEVGH